MYVVFYVEASRGAGEHSVTVKPTGCEFSLEEMKYLFKFIFSFLCSGIAASFALSSATQTAMLRTVFLSCCVRDTA